MIKRYQEQCYCYSGKYNLAVYLFGQIELITSYKTY